MNNDQSSEIQDRVLTAIGAKAPIDIRGAGTKAFLGGPAVGEPIDLTGHTGILDYHPKELVITARCGTRLDDIESTLAAEAQSIPFEPPRFGTGATIGGTIACGLSGPARPYLGAARDLVLGTRVMTGRGEILRFGGEVMKNVAGYDVSRLMTGAFGTLGLLLEISMKVLPRPACTLTLAQERGEGEALDLMNRWARKPLPITGTCFDGERLFVRLSGAEQGVKRAFGDIGGEEILDGAGFWQDKVREQGHGFFSGEGPLWRLSVPQSTPPLDLPGKQLIEWGGAVRWLRSDAGTDRILAEAAQAGGNARLFRRTGAIDATVSSPLPQPLMAIHRNLKRAFDPDNLLNRGRLFPEL